MNNDVSAIEQELLQRGKIAWDDEPLQPTLLHWAAAFGQLDETTLLNLFDRWMAGPEFVLHMTIPQLYVRMDQPSEALNRWILNAGISYPDPSYNRYFVEAAVRHLGLERVLQHLTDHFDRERNAVSAALYWARQEPSGLSGSSAANHDPTVTNALRKNLASRLKAADPNRRPWWKIT
jgi:hypothetical protein